MKNYEAPFDTYNTNTSNLTCLTQGLVILERYASIFLLFVPFYVFHARDVEKAYFNQVKSAQHSKAGQNIQQTRNKCLATLVRSSFYT